MSPPKVPRARSYLVQSKYRPHPPEILTFPFPKRSKLAPMRGAILSPNPNCNAYFLMSVRNDGIVSFSKRTPALITRRGSTFHESCTYRCVTLEPAVPCVDPSSI